MVVSIYCEVVAVVEVMAEFKGFPYYSKAFLFGSGPIYFTASKGSGSIRYGVFFAILAYLMDGGSYTVV